MSSSATASSITLKGSVAIVTEFFNYSINSILYQRGIYPPETFRRVSKYGLTMLVTSDDALVKRAASRRPPSLPPPALCRQPPTASGSRHRRRQVPGQRADAAVFVAERRHRAEARGRRERDCDRRDTGAVGVRRAHGHGRRRGGRREQEREGGHGRDPGSHAPGQRTLSAAASL